MTQNPVDGGMSAKEKLIQILDYVAHQASDSGKVQYEIPSAHYKASELLVLDGVSEVSSEDWWFKIKRPELPKENELEDEYVDFFIKNPEKQQIRLNLEKFESYAKITPLLKDHSGKYAPFKTIDAEKIKYAFEFIQACFDYMEEWREWIKSCECIKPSISVYDQFFTWHSNISMGVSQDNTEVVAGFGLVNWRLPTSGKYSYPLITIPLEIEIDEHGVLYVGPKDVRANVEMDGILLDNAVVNASQVRNKIKVEVNNGRFLDIFDSSSYSDLAQTFVVNIDSKAKIAESIESSVIDAVPRLIPTSMIFSRPYKSSVLSDDINALKENLSLEDTIIPEQPLSLVTELSDNRKEQLDYTFRGRSGVEGNGGVEQDLYFPLPYNKEQISIIKNLNSNCGVVVQGPPGTGKTHTIANIICHYLALGKKILVTAQQPHVLKTLHEKIPASLQHLVISRTGSSQESKRQLESNIDSIIQNLSHLNDFDTQREIDELKVSIDKNHEDMANVDREIFNFAQKHYQDIEVAGVKRTPMALADYALSGNGHYDWFKDKDISIDRDGDFPLTSAELVEIAAARRSIGTLLQDYYFGDVLDVSDLFNVVELKNLASDLKNISNLEEQISSSQFTMGDSVSLEHIVHCGEQIREYSGKLLQFYDEHPWTKDVISQLLSATPVLEFDVFCELIEKSSGLLEYRRALLQNPIDLPFDVSLNSKEYQAICRGATNGKPFSWYHFDGDSQAKFKDIKVSGKAPESAEEWAVVKQYVEKKANLVVFSTQWNALAPSLGISQLPKELSLDKTLKHCETVAGIVEQCIALNKEVAPKLKGVIMWVFTNPAKAFDLSSIEMCEELLSLIEAKTKISTLSTSMEKLQSQIHKVAAAEFYKSDVLLEMLQRVLSGDANEQLFSSYSDLLNRLTEMCKYKKQFDLLVEASGRLSTCGAVHLAHEISHVPCADMLEDPVLKDDLVDAWNWKRVFDYVNKISDTSEIEQLYQKRKSLEKSLSRNYETISAKKTWLALKQNASEKTLVSLNRYKIAVQKIGKGTGKNAPRYRKDAQDALAQVTQSIPCWIMSHYQVSESMPATVGMFDLVIVDEASQSSIDAIPVLLRAKKLLVVGDDKQVSPSNVGLSAEQIETLRNKYLFGLPHKQYLTPDMSLYDMATSIYNSNVMLMEHFRCHPDIIAYSNTHYYHNSIKPMRISKNSEQMNPPLVGIYVEDGARESKGNKHINRKEADAIIEEMHNIFANPRYKGKTIGVISLLGDAQAEYIQTKALDEFGAELLTSVKFNCGEASSFQGAERDIIFLSMIADPLQCSPLSNKAHEQRLNVAASRARERMYLVSSVKAEHLSSKDLRVDLLNHFYSRTVHDDLALNEKLELCESGFEKEVLLELVNLGYRVTPQVKVGSYRIDMVVESDGDNRLAVECDGDSFHGPDVWTQDMIRQRDLERAGWTFWRCFASSWFMEKPKMVKSLVEMLDRMGIRPESERNEAA